MSPRLDRQLRAARELRAQLARLEDPHARRFEPNAIRVRPGMYVKPWDYSAWLKLAAELAAIERRMAREHSPAAGPEVKRERDSGAGI